MIYQITPFNQPDIYHAFSTVEDGNMSFKWGDTTEVIKNRTTWLNKLGLKPEQCVTAELEHLTNIIAIDKTQSGLNMLTPHYSLQGDVLVTAEKNLYLFLIVADCLPWLIFDKTHKVISLIHASRQNTELNVVGQTLSYLQKNFNTQATDLLIAAGPAINKCCYEFNNIDKINQVFWGQYLQPSPTGTFHLDFINKNIDQLKQLGVDTSQIFLSPDCTGHSDIFFSHHRDQTNGQPDTGRFAALLGLKSF